jgi:muramoyltetrapeptide carboxypeptidase
MMDAPNIKAIFMARGGYGASQLLDQLSFNRMRRHPKWVIGFSDATALHIALNNAGSESIHGPMMSTLGSQEESGAFLHAALFNEG